VRIRLISEFVGRIFFGIPLDCRFKGFAHKFDPLNILQPVFYLNPYRSLAFKSNC